MEKNPKKGFLKEVIIKKNKKDNTQSCSMPNNFFHPALNTEYKEFYRR
jgi:hypothetical protein